MTGLTLESIQAAINSAQGAKHDPHAMRNLLETKYILTREVRSYLADQGYDTEEKITKYLARLGLRQL